MFLGYQLIVFVGQFATLYLSGCKNINIVFRDTEPNALTRTVVQIPLAFMFVLAIMAAAASALPFFSPPSINTSFETLTVQDHPVNAGPLVDEFLLSGTTHCQSFTWSALLLLLLGQSCCTFYVWCDRHVGVVAHGSRNEQAPVETLEKRTTFCPDIRFLHPKR